MEVKQAVADPKAKGGKGPADTKEPTFTEEEEATYGNRKIYLEYKPELEEQQEVAFNIKVFYQGPEYEDPNPPKEEEVVKKPPAKGKPAEVVVSAPQIRMIKPESVLQQNESGRTFQFEIGKNIAIKVPKDNMDVAASQDSQPPATEFETVNKWQRFYFDQSISGEVRIGLKEESKELLPSVERSKEVLSSLQVSKEALSTEEQAKDTQWQEPTDDMLYNVMSVEGVASV